MEAMSGKYWMEDSRIMKWILKVPAILITFFLPSASLLAQNADTLIRRHLETEGVRFSCDNSVKLLMSGQEKFDDMFDAIRHARKSHYYLKFYDFLLGQSHNLQLFFFDLSYHLI